jgi:hypothetical protein
MRQQLTPKWSTKLAAYDVYIWDHYAMENSLRIEKADQYELLNSEVRSTGLKL